MPRYHFALAIDETKRHHFYRRLPLHCTLLHWFDVALPASHVIEIAQPLFRETRPICIVSEAPAMFGVEHDIPVHTVAENPALRVLHAKLYGMITGLGAIHSEPQFSNTGYRPHVTTLNERALTPGEQHLCTEVYLTTKKPIPSQIGDAYYILEMFPLKQGD